MKKTNIYFLIDCSAFRSREENEKVRQTIKQMKRALLFANAKVKTHLICYCMSVFLFQALRANANTRIIKIIENVLCDPVPRKARRGLKNQY